MNIRISVDGYHESSQASDPIPYSDCAVLVPILGILYSSSGKHDDGGYAILKDASVIKVDESQYRSDPLNNDVTFRRYPDGHDTNTDGDWGYMMGSIGAPNEI